MVSIQTAPASPPASVPRAQRLLTRAEFLDLAELPSEAEWFANIQNANTRRAYRNDLGAFMRFVGIERPEEFRTVTRAHVLAWRAHLAGHALAPATIRRKLSALSALFDHLCDANAITHNPVKGVARPREGANEGKTPALSDEQAKRLLHAPDSGTLKGKRDHATRRPPRKSSAAFVRGAPAFAPVLSSLSTTLHFRAPLAFRLRPSGWIAGAGSNPRLSAPAPSRIRKRARKAGHVSCVLPPSFDWSSRFSGSGEHWGAHRLNWW